MAFENLVRFSAVATAEEKYWEPAQPPSDSEAMTFCRKC